MNTTSASSRQISLRKVSVRRTGYSTGHPCRLLPCHHYCGQETIVGTHKTIVEAHFHQSIFPLLPLKAGCHFPFPLDAILALATEREMRQVELLHFHFRRHLRIRDLTGIPHPVLLLHRQPRFFVLYWTYGLIVSYYRVEPAVAHLLACL